MNREVELKLQAFVDGELSGGEARDVELLLETDAEARGLVHELKTTKGFLAGNEPEVTVPESREFYWSKIARGIEKPEPRPVRRGWELLLAWRRVLAPVAGMALVLFLAIGMAKILREPGRMALVQNLSEYTGSFSFHSSDNMFVVWVYEKPQSIETLDLDEDVFVQ
jgi:anti-sigma factor RsiW